jgi:hypothetical protein
MNPQSYRKKPSESTTISATGKSSYEGIARIAFEIGKRQSADLRRIRDALDAGDNAMALALMREFFVLHNDGSVNETKNKKAQ